MKLAIVCSLLISHYRLLLLLLQNENDPTILSGWRHVVPVEEFFDILNVYLVYTYVHVGPLVECLRRASVRMTWNSIVEALHLQ